MKIILILIACVLVLGLRVINTLIDSLSIGLSILVIIIVLLILHIVIVALKDDNDNKLYYVGEIIMIGSITLGSFFLYGELIGIDKSAQWLTWFGEGLGKQLLVCISIILIASLILLLISAIPIKYIQNISLICWIIFPLCLYTNGLFVCSESYSDYVTTSFTSEEKCSEYQIVKDTKIYYRNYYQGESILPAFSPIKFSTHEFKEGETVYSVYHSLWYCKDNVYSYICVSNGTIGGYISVDDLKKSYPQKYSYKMQTKSDDCPVYGIDIQIIEYRPPLNDQHIYSRTNEIIDTLNHGEEINVINTYDSYIRIQLSDGREGYISRNNVEVIRTPIN